MKAERAFKQRGFTITETLIVLAVAGLILMIIFLAIPSLQRSSRNNQRRQDVQAVLQAVSHYELNNSGNVPDTGILDTYLQQHVRLTYYDPSNVNVTTPLASSVVGQIANDTDADHIHIYNHAKCDSANLGAATNAGAGYNDVVALYSVETGNNDTAIQCQQL